MLDNQRVGAEGDDGARSLHEIVVAGQHADFGVVDEQHVEAFENFKQGRAMVLDPVVHGVAGDELDARHRFAHAALQHGIDVGEEEKVGVAIGVGNFGLEGGEDIQLGRARFGFVEIFEVGTFPKKALAGGALDAAGIDITCGKDGLLLGAKVFAYDGDHAHASEEAGSEREVSGRAAQATLAASGGGFDRIVSDAADDGDGHDFLSCAIFIVQTRLSMIRTARPRKKKKGNNKNNRRSFDSGRRSDLRSG